MKLQDDHPVHKMIYIDFFRFLSISMGRCIWEHTGAARCSQQRPHAASTTQNSPRAHGIVAPRASRLSRAAPRPGVTAAAGLAGHLRRVIWPHTSSQNRPSPKLMRLGNSKEGQARTPRGDPTGGTPWESLGDPPKGFCQRIPEVPHWGDTPEGPPPTP